MTLLLAAALTACTGSYEPPAPSFLAVASGDRVDFYLTTRLRPDVRDDGQSPLIGAWTGLPQVLDLYHRLKQSEQQNNRLWVLHADRLTAYSTDPFFEDAVPDLSALDPRPFLFTDGSADNPQPVDCSRGYLRSSPGYLLAVCPPAPNTGAPYALYLADFRAVPPGGVPDKLIGPINVQASRAVFTLTTSNALVILNGDEGRLELRPDAQMTGTEPGIVRSNTYNQPFFEPRELVYDSAGNRVFGLLRGSTDALLLTWNLREPSVNVSGPDPNGRRPDQLLASTANVYALSSQQGIFRVLFASDAFRLLDPAGDVGLNGLSYLEGTLEGDRLLYLAAEDPGAAPDQKPLIVVLNSQKPLETLLPSDVKINSNRSSNPSALRITPFASRPVSMAVFPVQERQPAAR
ncbi:MAG: hypothetical protein C4333_01430 [Meiothermus sp.]